MARPGRRVDSFLGAIVVKRVLMVAYHFPPMNVSSGIQRTPREHANRRRTTSGPSAPRPEQILSDTGVGNFYS
jgi:hypothetical protein